MNICFFEDEQRKNLYPFYLTRPIDLLRTGILTIKEKWQLALPEVTFYRDLPDPLRAVYTDLPSPDDHTSIDIYLNAASLPNESFVQSLIKLKSTGGVLTDQHNNLIAYSGDNHEATDETSTVTADHIQYGWDLFQLNASQISADLKRLQIDDNRSPFQRLDQNVMIIGKHTVYIDPSASIEPNVTIFANEGPVFIGKDATIECKVILRGPVGINEHATIKSQSEIKSGTTVGPWCKVAGEINNVVFTGYSNKSHSGFLGNSVVGEWVNLGADTNGSNLKNNYSSIRAKLGEEEIDTGLMFFGQLIGDHTKTAINTMMNTGSVFGPFTNIAIGDFPPKYTSPFTWLTKAGQSSYNKEKALKTAEMVMSRRNKALNDDLRALYESMSADI